MQNAGFACLLKDFESQVRRSLWGQHGFILSNPDHPGEIMFFLLGAGDTDRHIHYKGCPVLFYEHSLPLPSGYQPGTSPFPADSLIPIPRLKMRSFVLR